MGVVQSAASPSLYFGQTSVSLTFGATPTDDGIVYLAYVQNAASPAARTWPTGFVEIAHGDGGNGLMWISVAWKRAASEGSATYTLNLGDNADNNQQLFGVELDGRLASGDPNEVVGSVGQQWTHTSLVIPGITTLTDGGDHIIFLVATDNFAGTLSAPGYDASQAPSFSRSGQVSKEIATAGPTGDITISGVATGEHAWVALSVAPEGGAEPEEQPLTAPLLTNASTLYAPTLTPGSVAATAPLLTNTSALYGPTMTPGSVALNAPLTENAQTIYGPTVAPGAASVTAPLLTNTQTFYGPALTPGSVGLAAPLIDSAAQPFAPTVAPGSVTVTAPLLTNTSELYAPTVTLGAVTVTAPLIGSSSVLYGPTVTAAGGLSAPLIESTEQVFAPSVTPGAVALTVPLVASAAQLFGPTLVSVITLTAPLIEGTGSLYVPTLTPGSVAVVVPLLANASALYGPTLSGGGVAQVGALATAIVTLAARAEGAVAVHARAVGAVMLRESASGEVIRV